MFKRIITNLKNLNEKSVQNFIKLKFLKGDSYKETFNNVFAYNGAQKLKNEANSIGGIFIKKSEKEEITKIRNTFIDEIEEISHLPKEKLKEKAINLRKRMVKQNLKLKKAKGKKITKQDIANLKDPSLKGKKAYFKRMALISGLACFANKDNIENAYKEMGVMPAIEQADKSALMGIFGYAAITALAPPVNAGITTIALHLPKGGRFAKIGSIALALVGLRFSIPLIDKIWRTEFEKTYPEKLMQPYKFSE